MRGEVDFLAKLRHPHKGGPVELKSGGKLQKKLFNDGSPPM